MLVLLGVFLIGLTQLHSNVYKELIPPKIPRKPLITGHEYDDAIARYIGGAKS